MSMFEGIRGVFNRLGESPYLREITYYTESEKKVQRLAEEIIKNPATKESLEKVDRTFAELLVEEPSTSESPGFINRISYLFFKLFYGATSRQLEKKQLLQQVSILYEIARGKMTEAAIHLLSIQLENETSTIRKAIDDGDKKKVQEVVERVEDYRADFNTLLAERVNAPEYFQQFLELNSLCLQAKSLEAPAEAKGVKKPIITEQEQKLRSDIQSLSQAIDELQDGNKEAEIQIHEILSRSNSHFKLLKMKGISEAISENLVLLNELCAEALIMVTAKEEEKKSEGADSQPSAAALVSPFTAKGEKIIAEIKPEIARQAANPAHAPVFGKLNGIFNTGLTCYAISTFQCIANPHMPIPQPNSLPAVKPIPSGVRAFLKGKEFKEVYASFVGEGKEEALREKQRRMMALLKEHPDWRPQVQELLVATGQTDPSSLAGQSEGFVSQTLDNGLFALIRNNPSVGSQPDEFLDSVQAEKAKKIEFRKEALTRLHKILEDVRLGGGNPVEKQIMREFMWVLRALGWETKYATSEQIERVVSDAYRQCSTPAEYLRVLNSPSSYFIQEQQDSGEFINFLLQEVVGWSGLRVEEHVFRSADDMGSYFGSDRADRAQPIVQRVDSQSTLNVPIPLSGRVQLQDALNERYAVDQNDHYVPPGEQSAISVINTNSVTPSQGAEGRSVVPPVVVVQLKRVQPNAFLQPVRSSCKVQIPSNGIVTIPGLDTPYRVVGVSCHHGSAGGGHYTAVRRLETGDWIHFDDSRVGQVSNEEALRLVAEESAVVYLEPVV